ncbi:Mannosylfructose-phosphate synthase [compost metagenome]
MKVVIPVEELSIGGGCKVLVDTAQALTARGHEVEIVILRDAPIKYPIPCKLTKVIGLLKETIPYGDIILTNFYTTFASSYAAWPEQTVRISLGFEPLWVADAKTALWTYSQQVPIISISSWLDNLIYDHVKQRTYMVPLGVDPLVFYPQPKSKRKIAGDPKIILYIARDPQAGYELKGFNEFKASMDIVKNEWTEPFIVYLICPGTALPLPGIPHTHFFPENDKQMADLYRKADVFVSSSWFEAFSLPPLESMACGTPVVTTNSGGVMDFCTHLDNAYVTAPKDPRALAQGICAVLSDPILSKQMISSGLRIANQYTKEQFEINMVEVLERIYWEGKPVNKGREAF